MMEMASGVKTAFPRLLHWPDAIAQAATFSHYITNSHEQYFHAYRNAIQGCKEVFADTDEIRGLRRGMRPIGWMHRTDMMM